MPHPEREHELMIEVARLRRECDALHMRAVSAETRADRNAREVTETLDALSKATDRTVAAQEALAAARRECEGLRAVAQAVIMFHSARVWDDAASEEWHRLTGGPSTTKGLCDFARTALAAPADGGEGMR